MKIRQAILAAIALAGAAAAQAEEARSIAQYGVTWTFDTPCTVGRFATGDGWVVGPVAIRSVEPAPEAGRSGSVVNPAAGRTQGYSGSTSTAWPAPMTSSGRPTAGIVRGGSGPSSSRA